MKVRIYGVPSCTYCIRAKKFCEENNIPYEYVTVTDKAMFEQLKEMVGTPIHTVPQIFINEDGFDEYVGGYDELCSKMKNAAL